MELHIRLSSTGNAGALESHPSVPVLQGTDPPDSLLLASATVVRGADSVVSSSTSGVSLPRQWTVDVVADVTSTSRVEFLRSVLVKQFSDQVANIMLRALRPSSVRQYESCWRRFQDFLRQHSITSLSPSVVLDLLEWLANARSRAAATVSAHYVALADPLFSGFNISVDETLTLLKRGIRARRVPRRPTTPKWSLHRVLQHLTFEGAGQLSENQLLQRAVFLFALATGYRASQLAAFTRHIAFTSFEDNMTGVTMAPSPSFLAKNKQADDLIGPLKVPSFNPDGSPHPLCPVHALHDYMRATNGINEDYLFYNSTSRKALQPRSLARLLCRVIGDADQGHAPRGHGIRGVATSLTFLRTHSLDRVMDLGGLGLHIILPLPLPLSYSSPSPMRSDGDSSPCTCIIEGTGMSRSFLEGYFFGFWVINCIFLAGTLPVSLNVCTLLNKMNLN